MSKTTDPGQRAVVGHTQGMPVILQYVWLGLTVILTLTGLASIVDGFVVWADFIGQIVQVYKSTLRDPIARLVDAAWPMGWPRIPKLLFDVLIIWTSFFTALRLFWAREGQWLRDARRNARISWPLAFALGPFVGSYYSVKFGGFLNEEADEIEGEAHLHATGEQRLTKVGLTQMRKRREALDEARSSLRLAIANLGKYYVLIAAAFVMLLFINYQVKRAERLTDQQVGSSAASSIQLFVRGIV